MDAVPEKFYYVPLPRVRRLHVRDVRRLVRMRMRLVGYRCLRISEVGVFRSIIPAFRASQKAGRTAKSWWKLRRLDAALCIFVLASGVVLALIAAGVT
jgi:hypothetical protein